MAKPKNNPRLVDRDHEILAHVMRYRLTTPEVLHSLYFSDCERNAVTKVTKRLCEHEFLAAHPLYDRYIYFTLGKRGARVHGISPKKAVFRGAQSLYREFGTMAFCVRRSPERERLRSGEFRLHYPTLVTGRVDTSHYFLESVERAGEAGRKRLGYVWVDGAGPIDHIVRTLKSDVIEPRNALPDFRRLIDAGRFVIAVVTLTEGKREQLARILPKIPFPISFYVEVVPELVHLLPGLKNV